jgi:ribonuclease BN (tRNA processing enzyme)
MAALGLPWHEITHVALTHFHADHTADLATLIYGWRFGLEQPRTVPVQLIGPAGLARRLAAMLVAFGTGLLENPPPITIIELSAGEEWKLDDDLLLGCRKVPHTEESVAYSVSGHGRRVVVSGDTGFDAELGTWADGCDVLLCECSLPDSMALPLHLTPRQCGALAAIARPGRLALTHFYPPVEREPIHQQVAESFDGAVDLCEDGWSTTIEAL